MKNIIEKQIHILAEMGHDFNPAGGYKEWLKVFESIAHNMDEVDLYLYKAITKFHESGELNYVLGQDFFNKFVMASKRFDPKKVPASMLYLSESFQVTTPNNHPNDYVFYCEGNKKEFNLFVNIFSFTQNNVSEGNDDFCFYKLPVKEGMTCYEVFSEYMKNTRQISGNISETDLKLLMEMFFNLWINTILYLKSGNPDIRHLRAKRAPLFKGKKNKSKLRKYKEVTFSNCILVGYNWKKETIVQPHFQGYWVGEGRSKYIIKLKDSYTKGEV